MSLPTSPHRADQEARALRERLELAALGDDDLACSEAARAVVAFATDHIEYRVLALIPELAPVNPTFGTAFPARFAGACAICQRPVAEGSPICVRDSDRAVAHARCAGAR